MWFCLKFAPINFSLWVVKKRSYDTACLRTYGCRLLTSWGRVLEKL